MYILPYSIEYVLLAVGVYTNRQTDNRKIRSDNRALSITAQKLGVNKRKTRQRHSAAAA